MYYMCMYVYMYVRMYVCMYVCIYIYIYIHTRPVGPAASAPRDQRERVWSRPDDSMLYYIILCYIILY